MKPAKSRGNSVFGLLKGLLILIVVLVGSSLSIAGEQPWSFVFLADSRSSGKDSTGVNFRALNLIAHEISKDIKNPGIKCELVLFGGDLIIGQSNEKISRSNPAQFQEWKSAMKPVYEAFRSMKLPTIPLYVVRGNHEVYHRKAGSNAEGVLKDWLSEFGNDMPQNGPPPPDISPGQTSPQKGLNYSLKHRDVLFVAVDQYLGPEYDPLINEDWLEITLRQEKTGPHVFVFAHAPAWPAFKTKNDRSLFNYPESRDRFWKILERGGCRVYFTGHQHYTAVNLIRAEGKPDMWQIMSGSAGAPLTKGTPDLVNPESTTYANNTDYGYYLCEVDGDFVTMRFKRYSKAEKKWKSDEASVVKYRVN